MLNYLNIRINKGKVPRMPLLHVLNVFLGSYQKMKKKNFYKLLPQTKKTKAYKIFVSICFLVAIYLFISDKGAPCPPFENSSFETIDCNSLSFNKINDRKGQIDFIFNAEQTLEYIPEYLPFFIQIKLKTEDANFTYSGKLLKNITYDETEKLLSASVMHSFSGLSNIKFTCLNKEIGSIGVNLKPIQIYEKDHSFADALHTESLLLHNVCLEYEKFLYFTSIKGDMPSVPFDSDAFRFEFLQWPLSAYLNHKNVNLTKGTSFMLSNYHKEAWKQLLFNINPLLNDIQKQAINKNSTEMHFIFRKEIDKKALPILRKLEKRLEIKSTDRDNIQALDPIQCFDDLIMTKTKSNVQLSDNKIVNESLHFNFSLTKKLFRKGKMENKLIVVPTKYLDIFKNNMKDFNFIGFNEHQSFSELVDLASKANILIGDHLSTLLFSLFLNEKATLIDITPSSFSCNRWIDSYPTDAKVISIFNDSSCACDSFSCYLAENKLIDNTIDYNELSQIIRNNLIN